VVHVVEELALLQVVVAVAGLLLVVEAVEVQVPVEVVLVGMGVL
jgi:hypothetical protein